jgi:hypothetical protein
VDFLQFIGTIAPNLAPALLISFLTIKLVLEFIKERRELLENFKVERKEWRDAYEALLRESRLTQDNDLKNYHTTLVQTVAVERDIVNQVHRLNNEIQRFFVEFGRKPSGSD